MIYGMLFLLVVVPLAASLLRENQSAIDAAREAYDDAQRERERRMP